MFSSPLFPRSPLFGGSGARSGGAAAASDPEPVQRCGPVQRSGAPSEGVAVWCGAVAPPKPRGANTTRPAVPGPFDGGATLPQGEEELSQFMKARCNDATASKHVAEVEKQLVLYEERCIALSVPPYPVNPDALLLHLEQKACDNGCATSVRNWASNIRALLARTRKCRAMNKAEEDTMERGIARLEKKYGVYHAAPAAVKWQGLRDAVLGTAVGGAPLSARLKATALQAAIVNACGLRPGEHTRKSGKEPLAVKHVTFHPRDEARPFGALELKVQNRKATVATGWDKNVFHSVFAEPPCMELDFVSQLRAATDGMSGDEPLFASMDASGDRRRIGQPPGIVHVPIHLREYNANFKELMARAGVCNVSARSLRYGFATSMAEEGADKLVTEARMAHGARKRSRTAGYVEVGLDMLPASRPWRRTATLAAPVKAGPS